MKKLGIYISSFADTAASSPYLTKGSFVYYELIRHELRIWCPSKEALIHKKPEEVIFLRSQDDVKRHVMSIYEAWTDYYMLYNDTTCRMRSIQFNVDYMADCQVIDDLSFESIDGRDTWSFSGDNALAVLYRSKAVKLDIKTSYSSWKPIRPYKHEVITKQDIENLVMPDSLVATIAEDIKKQQEKWFKDLCNSYYGGFTTRPVLSPEEIDKIFDSKNKETKTMEKKKMTVTDLFLKDIDSITITSTYTKLDCGCGQPYYIYYPEMEITEDIADILLTVLLMAKKDFIHKVVFNPEKGTTMLYRNFDKCTITVRCRDGEFDYILGYNMARSKMYIGTDDYNWFNKIKNHRKTHIEYTEKKTKKGGKK